MKRHDSDLDPELEAFLTPRKIQRETPPEFARAGARRARERSSRREARSRALPRAICPAASEGAGTARSPSGLDRLRGVGRGGRRRGRSGRGALRPNARARRRSPGRSRCGPGAECVPDERRHSVERTARTRRPRARGGQAAPPGASRRESDPFTAELELLQRAHGAYTRRDFSARADAGRGARAPVPERAPRRAARGVARRSLVGSGRADEAHRAAAAFAIHFPRSVLLPRVAGGSESAKP